jgi:beta-glucanase (GH16 family)
MHSSENKGLCRSALVKHPNLFHIFGEIFAYVPPTQSSDRASLNFFNRTIPAQSTSLWPAFWLLGSNCQNANKFSGDTGFGGCPNLGQSSYTEIDMVECYGSGWCQFHIANPSFGIGNGCDATYAVDTNFHTFQTVWTPTSIKQYMDGVLETTCNQSLGNPMFLIMQIQTGGVGGTPNNILLPANMEVDFVKVTQP